MAKSKKKNKDIEEEKTKEIKVEENNEELDDTFIDSNDLKQIIDEDKDDNKKNNKSNKSIILIILSIIALIGSLILFGIVVLNKETSIYSLISSLILTIFTIVFTAICVTYKGKNKNNIFLSCILLIIYFILGIFVTDNKVTVINRNVVPNFSGKSIDYVVKWANKNKIELIQDYEYSDMIQEYSIISQDVKENTSICSVCF